MKLICTFFLFSFFPVFLTAQVSILEFPLDNQLVAREIPSNQSLLHLRGTWANVLADSLVFRVERSDGMTARSAFPLDGFPNDTFDIAYPILAGLLHHQLQIHFKNADSTWLVASASNVVSGDVIVVQGQSNAQAVAYNGDANVWQNNFVRCLGSSNPLEYTLPQWYIAEGNGYFTPGAVGQWALRMASLLQEQTQIPIAIVNGADPGKPIEFFQRNDAFPTDPATNYGRLLHRLNLADLAPHVRAVIYYQGESDGDRADIHRDLFEALHADWQSDLPQVDQYYVVQVREGCGAPSLRLRQYQRDFGDYLPNTTSLTANGLLGHDGCHYNVLGYGQLGEKLAKHLAADLYGQSSGPQLNVRVLAASYTNDTNTQIELLTDAAALLAQTGSGVDFKILGGSSAVIGINTVGNKIVLDLDQPVYDASVGISYTGHSGDVNGWVLNADGYGLFSFADLPIENHTELPNFDLPGIMSGPGNCLSFDGQNDCVSLGQVLGNSYTKEAWIHWNGAGLGNNMISGVSGTAFWMPAVGNDFLLCAGHNGAWTQVFDPMPMTPFQWTHVALSYDEASAEMRLYRNGRLVSQAQNVPPHNDPELYIGAFVGVYTFHGKMDEVRVWDYARSLDDIRANMCQKLRGNESGLSAYFRFDQWNGPTAESATEHPDGQLLGFESLGWQRSAAPLGTKSTYAYQDTSQLRLALAAGDSLVLSNMTVTDFVHLYFTEELPNVLEPSQGHVLVDNQQYFGVYYPGQSIDSFRLSYHYKGNPFTLVDEPRLGLLQREHNAQPYWETADSIRLDFTQNTLVFEDKQPQEYILAIRENTVGTLQPSDTETWVYPNPSTGLLRVKEGMLTSFMLYDALGQRCFAQHTPATMFDVRMLPAGLYWAEMRDEQGRSLKQKVIID